MIGMPLEDALVGEAQAPHSLRTRGEFHAPWRHGEWKPGTSRDFNPELSHCEPTVLLLTFCYTMMETQVDVGDETNLSFGWRSVQRHVACGVDLGHAVPCSVARSNGRRQTGG